MARGRMLNNKISLNKAVNKLSDRSQLAYTWAISHLDFNGVMHGEPSIFLSIVFPRRRDIKATEVEKFINEWSLAGLVVYYEDDGDYWLHFPAFEENQVGLRKDRETASGYPLPEGCRIVSGEVPESIPRKLTEVKVSKDKIKHGEVVTLEEDVYNILCYQYGHREVDGKIDDINNYCLSKGRTYKDYAATIRAWLKKDGIKPKSKPKVCERGHYYTGDICEECI